MEVINIYKRSNVCIKLNTWNENNCDKLKHLVADRKQADENMCMFYRPTENKLQWEISQIPPVYIPCLF